jgi:serine/threonine protein kinase/Tol biopolymer transport system component
MTTERWQRIEALYNQMLELPATERGAALAAACNGDAALEGEVQSLLDRGESSGRFLELPALHAAARLITPASESLIGRRIGAFEVLSLLGAGGMGEVYRARDTRLGRDVAIKILPRVFQDDAGRVARLEREARLLAALNHPHVGAIYGLEATEGLKALVMELVDGENLAQRIERGPLAVAEAVDVARQIAAALEAAHAIGVVHRDLKPANIARRSDGVIKVLDFGLAKLVGAAANGLAASPPPTQVGGVVGTPAYMSPEQARGEAADHQSDIWSFGVVFYEMLTGLSPFAQPSTAETFARVLEGQPEFSLLPTHTPAGVRRVIRRCLEKDRNRRLHHIADVRIDLEETSAARPDDLRQPSPARRGSRSVGVAAAGVVLAIGGLLGLGVWGRTVTESPREPVHLVTMLGTGVSVTRGPGLGSSVAVSPDGRTIVIGGTDANGQRLFSRALDRLEATPLAGTERGSSPFFSWDGAWIGFFADGRLKRVPVDGGAAVDIVTVPGAQAGASWGPDGRIVFAYGGDGQIRVVDASGGDPEPLSGVKSGYYPDVLPDGTVLFQADGWVHLLDRATGRQHRLVRGGTPRYAMGHVIVNRDATLLAAPFDLKRREVRGNVVPVVDNVAGDASPASGLRHYAISRAGTLAYVPAASTYALALVAGDGRERIIADHQRAFLNPQFSPDGRYIAVATTRRQGEPPDIWIHDLVSGTATRITSGGGRAPVWTSDGKTITYSHPIAGERRGIYAKAADGRGAATRLVALDAFHWLVGWTPDRRALVYGVMEGTASSIAAFENGRSRRIVGPSSTWGGRLSPDGRWLTYYSLDSGNFEVFATPFPESGTTWLIGAGTDPTWSPDGDEIYYRAGSRLVAARVDKTAGVRVLSQRIVIEPFLPPLYDDYAVHPDGRAVIHVRPSVMQEREVTVVVDWFTELRRLVDGS